MLKQSVLVVDCVQKDEGLLCLLGEAEVLEDIGGRKAEVIEVYSDS